MLPAKGIIYLSEKLPDGNRVTIMVEETPDNLAGLPAFEDRPREELNTLADKKTETPPRAASAAGFPPTVRKLNTGGRYGSGGLQVFRNPAQPQKAGPEALQNPIRGHVTFSDQVGRTPHIYENPVEDLELTMKNDPNPESRALPPAVTIPAASVRMKPPSRPSVADSVMRQPQTASVKPPSFPHRRHGLGRKAGLALMALTLGGFTAPMIPKLRLETYFAATRTRNAVVRLIEPVPRELPPAAPIVFNPLLTPEGTTITPVNTDFSVIVPKIGINAPVTAGVDPGNTAQYKKVLETAVAHARTSYLPDQNGTVYLFSHSTNYDWFVKDLNAVFYLLKNLEEGDYVVLFYKGVRYTYQLKEKRVVRPNQISYLVPHPGEKKLILQTCWPPGSVAERLLLFADLVEEQSQSI